MNKEKAKQIALTTAEIGAKTALSLIPVGGALIQGVWDSVNANSADKRRVEWMNMLEERLSKLETSLEDIGQNESFTSALFQATEAAFMTADSKKREYLANAVLNSVQADYEESIVCIFIGLIRKYSLWHLQVLEFFSNPKKHLGYEESSYYMGSPKQPLFEALPHLQENEAFVDLVVSNLYADGLLNTENLNVTMTGRGMIEKRTTALGNRFIKFITQPNT